MIRVFSGSCLSLDEVDHVREVTFVERPHLLGPGVDYFTQDGLPLRPLLSSHTLNKVFSGSALDLNDLGGDSDPVAATSGNNDQTSSGRVDPTVSSIIAGLHAELSDAQRSQNNGTVVLVVGAGGYLGSYIVKAFLSAGYLVRATVDDLSDTQLNNEIYALHPDAPRRLTIVGLNIMNASAYRDHIRGAKYVVHCGVSAQYFTRNASATNVSNANKSSVGSAGASSPNSAAGPAAGKSAAAQPSGAVMDIQKAHQEAAQSLFDAVRSYGKGSVKRAIVLGSASAYASSAAHDAVIDESVLRKASKTVAEPGPLARIAFVNESIRLSKMVDVELTILLPTIMLGPSLVRESSEGMRTVLDLSSGSAAFPFAPRMYWDFVDVRDVAEAALKAAETDAAKNECFIVSNATLSMSELGRLIRKGHPHLSAPIYDAPTIVTMTLAPLTNTKISVRYLWKTLGVRRRYNNKKVMSALGLNFTDIGATVSDSVNELIHHGYVPAASGAKAISSYAAQGTSASAVDGSASSCERLKKAAVAVAALGILGLAVSYYAKLHKNKK